MQRSLALGRGRARAAKAGDSPKSKKSKKKGRQMAAPVKHESSSTDSSKEEEDLGQPLLPLPPVSNLARELFGDGDDTTRARPMKAEHSIKGELGMKQETGSVIVKKEQDFDEEHASVASSNDKDIGSDSDDDGAITRITKVCCCCKASSEDERGQVSLRPLSSAHIGSTTVIVSSTSECVVSECRVLTHLRETLNLFVKY